MDVPNDVIGLGVMGAQALVSAMITDAWAEIRDWFGQQIGRRSANHRLQAERLERSRQQLLDAEDADRARVQERLVDEWRVRLQDVLEEDPELAEQLRSFLSRWHAEHPPIEKEYTISQKAVAKRGGRVYQAGRDQTITDQG